MTAKQLPITSETTNEPILLVPSGKIRCYVHPDVLRNETPEEHVRQRVARSLVEEYGYDREDLHCEFPIKIGSGKRKKVDIAIFHAGIKHQQENIFIIVEAKQEDVRPTDRKEGVDQLKSYMAACVNAKGEVIEITKEVEEPIIDDQLPAVTQLFKNWLERKSPRWLHV